MDLTPRLFDDVEFREKWRGYDPEEVDAFLEQVSKAAEALQQRVKAAEERAERAEARARDANDADEALRRTLVLAQRTADAAIAEAEQRAATTVSEAEERAHRTVAEADARAEERTTQAAEAAAATVADAEAHAATLRADAERLAREGADDLRRQLREEIDSLSELRDHLRSDAARLEAHIEVQRARVSAALEALQRLVHDPDALREAPVPEFPAVHLPPEVADRADPATQPAEALARALEASIAADALADAEATASTEHADADTVDAADSVDAVERAEDVEPVDDVDEPMEPTEAHEPVDVIPAPPAGPVPPAPPPVVVALAAEDPSTLFEESVGAVEEIGSNSSGEPPTDSATVTDAHDTPADTHDNAGEDERSAAPTSWSPDGWPSDAESGAIDHPGQPEAAFDAAEMPTQESPVVVFEPSVGADDDDGYLAELRRAIVDPEPLGPRDVALADVDGPDELKWKGLRRRR